MRRMNSGRNSAMRTNRRNFLKLVGGVGAGLTLALKAPMSFAGTPADASQAGGDLEPNAFVRIGTDNKVTVYIKHVEMGQGTYTGLATLVAEELDADWSQVQSEGAPADAKRYNNLFWGPMQGTGGSTSIANSFEQMRLAGATARAMLVAAAAKRWSVPGAEITVRQGVVSHAASGNSATFGELAELAATLPIPPADSIRLKDPADFVLIGKRIPRKDTGKTDGTAVYTQDIKLDGMLTALVAHAPRFGARVSRYDDSKARASRGVVDVVQIPTGIAVLAHDFWSAKVGRDQLEIEWDESEASTDNSDDMMARYRDLSRKKGLSARADGDAVKALDSAATVLEATYEFPYLAHAAMEPMNCVAQVTPDGCEVWNGEQFQTVDQGAIAKLLGLAPEQVKLNMLFAGGSFGRRANPHSDYVLEAVNIAKAKAGTPVKLVWAREDDMHAGYYRPAYVHRLRGGLDADGNIVGWQQHIVGQSILTGTVFEGGMVKDGIDGTSVEGAANLPYAIPNLSVELTTVESKVPVQWWRSVGSTHTAYAAETFIDELAARAGKDPVELRLQLLKDHPRWQGVLKLAAEKANWGTPLPEGRGRGVAVHESFNTYVAQVAEVSVQPDGQFKVEKVVCAVDCGIAVNPDVILAQMEGGIGFGLAPALVSAITLEDGKVKQSNFDGYQVLRFNQMPEVEVHIVPSAQPPSGVGEPGVPPIAPAVANALAAATGKRHYQLPIRLAASAS